MSGPFGSSQWGYASGEGAAVEGQSLRFNDNDSAYLSWTPSAAGNLKTWTWSGWVKRGNLGVQQAIFTTSNSAGNDFVGLQFLTGDTLYFSANNGSASSQLALTTNAVFRDPSAWYHVVINLDTTQATSTDRAKVYVNGVLQTFSSATYPPLNYDSRINTTNSHNLGSFLPASGLYFDGYMAEVNFVDGTALDPTSFGETDANGQWVPIASPSVTYGTNGFYLPFTNDYEVEGFNTVTYRGNGADQYVGGVGFEPDFIWVKDRTAAYNSILVNSVAGVTNFLNSNTTNTESSTAGYITSTETDGFSLGSGANVNASGNSYVAWAWDAGTGSAVSNTEGSITSSVKANPDYGQSIVSYTNAASGAQTVGHGLTSAPEMVIVKLRSTTSNWFVYHKDIGNTGAAFLDSSSASATSSTYWNNTSPTSSVFSLGTAWNSSATSIAYCFHSVEGYSDFGSYTGTGASGNTVTTGFKPAFVMIKRTDASAVWVMHDITRDPYNPMTSRLYASETNAEATSSTYAINSLSDGFEVDSTLSTVNASGGTYIYMAFADKREAAFWLDQSGNNNDWTNNNMQESDISLDSPTNNFATWNATAKGIDATLSEGNLKIDYGSATTRTGTAATFGMTSGKWYWEVLIQSSGSGLVGIANTTENSSVSSGIGYYPGYTSGGWGYLNDGDKYNNATNTSYGSTFTTGDIIGVAFDADVGTLTFYKNNTSQGDAFTSLPSATYFPAVGDGSAASTINMLANFGQDSSFAGTKVAQGNTDENGFGDFYYEPPAGYLALCTQNLPDPAIKDGSENFNTVLYTGDGTSPRSVGGLDFQPDFVWTKPRSSTGNHFLYDNVRGFGTTALYGLYSDLTAAEFGTTGTNGSATAFTSDGITFTAGSSTNNNRNASGTTYAYWAWKADNTSGASNTDGTITSTVSANPTAGFSIVGYTGTGAVGTIGHGLASAPEMIIAKNRTSTAEWLVYHAANTSDPETDYLQLNNTAATVDNANVWNDTAPTSSVFSVGPSIHNTSGNDIISYCFHSVEGYSKIGSFTGNGSTDGTFVYTGFKPAFILWKRTSSTSNWLIWDNTRSPYNVVDDVVFPDLSNAESSSAASYGIDMLSNGFKLRNSNATVNGSGSTYIYMAFAESPFKYSSAR